MSDSTGDVVRAIQDSYDDVPYFSHPYPQTHPRHLASVASLFGLEPAPLESMSLLELGCASGGNIIPVAEAFPESQVVGVDLSRVQVEAGRQTIEALSLGNCRLEQGDLRDVDARWGRFDYIICHGVFSWVPRDVQERIFEICRENLAPNGVVYVSYNTYPGWHLRGMVRDMMLYHSDRFADPGVRVKQARALLEFLSSTSSDETAFGRALRAEAKLIKDQPDSYIYHEHLERSNQPLYFHDFVARAKQHGLQYLGESEVRTMMPASFPKDVQEALERVARDQLQAEQYMDFLRNRTFRQTLLCRADQQIRRRLNPSVLARFWLASHARRLEPEEQGASPVFATSVERFTARDPLLAAALEHLSEAWPASVRFDDVLTVARATRPEGATDDDAEVLAARLLRLYMTMSLLEVSITAPRLTPMTGERPKTTALARHQAERGKDVTSLRHRPMRLQEADRQVLRLLDGSHGRRELVGELVALVKAGTLVVRVPSAGGSDEQQVVAVCERSLDQVLPRLARGPLLIG